MLPNRVIQTSRSIYFQTRLPDPVTSNQGEPLGLSEEWEALDNEDFIEVTPPIEGEDNEGHTHPPESSNKAGAAHTPA
jgi:hypothetical protein